MSALVFFVVGLSILAILLLIHSERGYQVKHTITGFLGVLASIFSCVGLVVIAIHGWSWIASEHKARIINAEFGTTYTQEDIFYASDVIDEIRQIARHRYDIDVSVGHDTKK